MFCLNFSIVKSEYADSSIATANLAINNAFISILEAENSGLNVTSLLSDLNKAGYFLSEAKNACFIGNSSVAISMAEKATSLANQVNNDAIELLNSTLIDFQNNRIFTLVFSLFGSILFVCILFSVWRLFKRYYIKKFLHMKPEVLADKP